MFKLKTLSLAGAALAMSAGAIVPVAPAAAQSRYDHGYRSYDRGGYDGYRTYDRGGYDHGYRNYRAAQKCRDGDGGTLIGAIAGGLLGRSVAGRGDHVPGAVIGAGAGALAGRAIDRSDRPGYCR
jgi:hypothetical protein